MTTTKPRITVTLEPETAFRLKRMAELTGNSQSSMISEVLDQAGSVFDRLIQVLEAAESAKAQVKKSSVEKLVEAQNLIEKQLGLVLESFDDGGGVSEAPASKGRAGEGAAGRVGARLRDTARHGDPVAATPLSNRGVRSSPDVKKKNTKRAGNA